jgi:hypothetical protein
MSSNSKTPAPNTDDDGSLWHEREKKNAEIFRNKFKGGLYSSKQWQNTWEIIWIDFSTMNDTFHDTKWPQQLPKGTVVENWREHTAHWFVFVYKNDKRTCGLHRKRYRSSNNQSYIRTCLMVTHKLQRNNQHWHVISSNISRMACISRFSKMRTWTHSPVLGPCSHPEPFAACLRGWLFKWLLKGFLSFFLFF